MKRFINWLPMAVVTMFMMVMSACSDSSNSDVEALLKTVPQETSGVVVVDLSRMLEKVGIEAKDGELVLPAELKEAIGEDAAEDFTRVKGVKTDAAVVFMHRKTAVVTGYVSDQEAFRNYVTEAIYYGCQWKTVEDNLDVCGNVAIRGNQFWYTTEGVSTATILGWANLKENESILANNKLVAAMSADQKDVYIFYDVDRVKHLSNLGAEQMMAMSMMQEMFVRDMAYVSGWIDFGKDEVVAEMRCYNSKFEPAEYVVELEKINASLLSKLPKNSSFVMAFGTGSKMWATLCTAFSDVISSMTGGNKQSAVIEKALNAVRGLDGTVIAGIDANATLTGPQQMAAFVETKDAAAARDVVDLVYMFSPDIADFASLTAEDKLVKFTMGETGETGVDHLKSLFDGKLMAVYMDGAFVGSIDKDFNIIESIEITAETMDVMTTRIKIKGGKHANVLTDLLELVSKFEPEQPTLLEEAELDYEDILR